MMGEIKRLPKYQDIDGFRLPRFFSPDALRSCLRYKPCSDDVFIVTFPKCGTTWMQQIVRLIFHDGEPFEDGYDFVTSSPFLEMAGADAATIMPRPGSIKLHLPYHLTPYSPDSKYIYVARNPKDCCVSFYNHTCLLPMYDFADGDFDVYLENFIRGQTDFGDYFDNHLSWYEHRNDKNVLFLTYEDLKRKQEEWIVKIAGFLGKQYKDSIIKDNSLLGRICEKSGFSYMKDNHFYDSFVTIFANAIKEGKELSSGYLQLMDNINKANTPYKPTNRRFFRKGEVGDWKNFFTEQQERRFNERIAQKTNGTDLMTLWDDLYK